MEYLAMDVAGWGLLALALIATLLTLPSLINR